MSTGLDCYFDEKKPGEWYLFLERDYGSKLDPEYDRYGPFETFAVADAYLRSHFPNPGGFSVHPHAASTDDTWADVDDGYD